MEKHEPLGNPQELSGPKFPGRSHLADSGLKRAASLADGIMEVAQDVVVRVIREK
jgi:hypothetical protein